jgi:hypothetical protein
MLGKQLTSVISTLDAFFTKVKGQSPLSPWIAKHFHWPRTRTPSFNVFLQTAIASHMGQTLDHQFEMSRVTSICNLHNTCELKGF